MEGAATPNDKYPVRYIIPVNVSHSWYELKNKADGNFLICLPYEAINQMIEQCGRILADLANENIEGQEYWRDGEIIISAEKENRRPVFRVKQGNQIKVTLEHEACDLMIRMAKIIWHHREGDNKIDGLSCNLTTSKMIMTNIREGTVTIKDTNKRNMVTFPLMILALLWMRYTNISGRLDDRDDETTTFWSEDGFTIARELFINELKGARYTVLNFIHNTENLSIILDTFTFMLEKTIGRYFCDEPDQNNRNRRREFSDKLFEFPIQDLPNHFRITDERNKCYDLPTAALDAADEQRSEISSYFQNGASYNRTFWSDDIHELSTSLVDSSNTIVFIRRRDNRILISYKAEKFDEILDSYISSPHQIQ